MLSAMLGRQAPNELPLFWRFCKIVEYEATRTEQTQICKPNRISCMGLTRKMLLRSLVGTLCAISGCGQLLLSGEHLRTSARGEGSQLFPPKRCLDHNAYFAANVIANISVGDVTRKIAW